MTDGNMYLGLSSYYSLLWFVCADVEMGKPGGCPLCGMAFSRQVSLREHLHRKHNILEMKTSTRNGKRRGRPRKEPRETQVSKAEVPEAESELVGAAPSSELAACEDSTSQQTVHVVIDKIDEGDLTAKEMTNAGQQVDGSVKFPSSATTLRTQESDGSDLEHLVGQAQPVCEPHPSEDQPEASQQLSRSDISDSLDSPLGSRNTAPTKNNGDAVSSPAERLNESASQDDPDTDFLFVLLRTNIKGASLNYIRQGFKCFHCDFKSSWRRALIKHMRDKHADNLAIHRCIAVHKSEKLRDQQVSVCSSVLILTDNLHLFLDEILP